MTVFGMNKNERKLMDPMKRINPEGANENRNRLDKVNSAICLWSLE